MKVEASVREVTVTVTLTGHEAAWLAAVAGKLCGNATFAPSAKFLSAFYGEMCARLKDAGIGMPSGDDVVVVRDGKLWHASAAPLASETGSAARGGPDGG